MPDLPGEVSRRGSPGVFGDSPSPVRASIRAAPIRQLRANDSTRKAFLDVESILRLLEGKPARPVEDLADDLLAAVSRQEMHRDRSRSRQIQQGRVHLVTGERGDTDLISAAAPACSDRGGQGANSPRRRFRARRARVRERARLNVCE